MPKSEAKRKTRPEKRKKNQSLELLRAITRSMAGAIPGISDETEEVVEDTLARPVSGLMSQVMGVDPVTDEVKFPPIENLKRSWNADERRKQGLPAQPKIMPGIVADTLSLPNVLGNGPQFSQNAQELADATHANVGQDMGLDPARGFRQHGLEAAGTMLGQIPIAAAAKTKPAIQGGLSLAKHYGKKAMLSPLEFLSPTVDPKMSNYLLGSAAGGALGTLGDEAAEVAEEVPPPRAIARGKGGKVGALQQLLRAVSINPYARVKQTAHQIGDPVEEVLQATNEGQVRGVLSGDEAKRIKALLAAGEEEALAEALMDLHRRLNPVAAKDPTLQALPPREKLVFQDKGYREPVHGEGKLPPVESEVPLLKKRGGRITFRGSRRY